MEDNPIKKPQKRFREKPTQRPLTLEEVKSLQPNVILYLQVYRPYIAPHKMSQIFRMYSNGIRFRVDGRLNWCDCLYEDYGKIVHHKNGHEERGWRAWADVPTPDDMFGNPWEHVFEE